MEENRGAHWDEDGGADSKPRAEVLREITEGTSEEFRGGPIIGRDERWWDHEEEDGATATRDTQTSGEGGLTQTTTENIKDADTAKKISGNNNSKLLIQALMGKKSKSEVTGNTKEEDEAELLSNLAASGDKAGDGEEDVERVHGREDDGFGYSAGETETETVAPVPEKTKFIDRETSTRGVTSWFRER